MTWTPTRVGAAADGTFIAALGGLCVVATLAGWGYRELSHPHDRTRPPRRVRTHSGRNPMHHHPRHRRTPIVLAALALAGALLAPLGPVGAAPAVAVKPVPAATQVVLAAASSTLPVAARAALVIAVRPGDTLFALAGRYCGNPGLWPALWRANTSVHNPNLIFVGQRLTVACNGPAAATPVRTTAAPRVTGWVHPLASGARAVSCWGAPRRGHTHKGVDLPAASGVPIRAVAAGTVAAVTYQGGGAGWYVVIAHGGAVPVFTVYEHMRTRSPLRVGAHVGAGQAIGQVGATGNAEGPHLHFEVHRGGLWTPHQVDPAPFMAGRGVNVGC